MPSAPIDEQCSYTRSACASATYAELYTDLQRTAGTSAVPLPVSDG